ncbi:hypothetical protein [Curtobacterium sp. MCBA15_001]|uniref:hypothetical protein n=1 Tax=Curtobacterium sp. MCBA15_001 TaxID=1898731 RepID=UPI0008DE4584|nr:hypothetical protein [Curtobacterium sp. MCBA15_001]OIH93798.1 hypothetical protein BIU90_09235 [Curtobacterium sp. MCBA15_001]
METVTVEQWWTGPDDGPFAAWVADRAAADPTHCVRVERVGRDPTGRLVVRVEPLRGVPLPTALDRIGTLTVGVAVTLTVPLLELAAQGRAGSMVLGSARPDDVLVDDAGVTVLVDHPPGTVDPVAQDAPSAGPAVGARAARPTSVRSTRVPGPTALLLAARTVWERVDAREACRPALDHALATALDGTAHDVVLVLEAVRATGPPRPVRWELPPDDFAFAPPTPPAPAGITAVLRRWIEDGVPLPGGSRLPARRLLVGIVVLTGVAAAGAFALGGT